MADGAGIKQFTDEMAQATGEVAKDVKDAVGEMIETNAQTATNSQLTPQQLQPFDSAQGKQEQQQDQKKELDRQKQLNYTRAWLKNLEAAQNKVRMENKQKEQQRLQVQQQEKQVSEMRKEEKKKQRVNPAVAYAGKAEFKRGVGG